MTLTLNLNYEFLYAQYSVCDGQAASHDFFLLKNFQ